MCTRWFHFVMTAMINVFETFLFLLQVSYSNGPQSSDSLLNGKDSLVTYPFSLTLVSVENYLSRLDKNWQRNKNKKRQINSLNGQSNISFQLISHIGQQTRRPKKFRLPALKSYGISLCSAYAKRESLFASLAPRAFIKMIISCTRRPKKVENRVGMAGAK